MLASGAMPLSAMVVASRGVSNTSGFGDRSSFPSPDMLDGCSAAARLIVAGIESKQKFVIVGDYDADGATGTSVMFRWLRDAGALVDFLVPSRFKDGYGMSLPVAKNVFEMFSPNIVITVDNGMSSFEGVEFLKENGVSVIVTDHHLPHEKGLPKADVIVNPNKVENHPLATLAGVGVAWLVCRSASEMLEKMGKHFPDCDALLPLVALGTVADVVPLSSWNRDMVSVGLEMIREGFAPPALSSLSKVAKVSVEGMTTGDMGFMIAPRLNAAGRMGDMSDGIRCLISDDDCETDNLAARLDAMNRERRKVEEEMVSAIMTMLDKVALSGRSIVVGDQTFHEGVIGIVASRLKERFGVPSIVFSIMEDGTAKGSARSIPGFHMRDALEAVNRLCPGVMLKFGGHAMAAGMTIKAEDFKKFQESFAAVSNDLVSDSMLSGEVFLDGDPPVEWLMPEMVWELDGLPFGQGFPPPLFASRFEVVSHSVMKEKHLKLVLEKEGKRFQGVMFNTTDVPSSGSLLSYGVSIDSWSGNVKIMLRDVVEE